MRIINVRLLICSIGCLVLLGAATALVHFLQSGRIAKALLGQAERAINEDHPEEAARFLSRYLEFLPEDIDQRARLGVLLASDRIEQSGQKQRALFVLEQVLARDPNRHESRLLLVRVALDLQRYELVEGHLKALQEALPENGEVERLTGCWHEARGQFPEAIEWYRKAVVHDPEKIDSYVRLAHLLRRHPEAGPPTPTLPHKGGGGSELRSPFSGESDLTRSPSPGDSGLTRSPSPLMGEGGGGGAEADRLMDDMVSHNKGDYHVHLARWQYRKQWGEINRPQKLERAGRDVARALELAPEETEVLLAAAELERLKQQPNRARSHLETALRLHPQDVRVYRALSFLELDESRSEQAIACLERGAGTVRDRFHLLWDLANLQLDAGNSVQASKVIDQVQDAQPTPGAVDYLRGRLKMTERQWSESVRILEQVRPLLEVSPELIEQVDLNLGRCYERLNEPAAQLAAYGRVVARNPESKSARAGMAEALTALGRIDDALEQYRQLMNLPAASPSGWIEIGRLAIQRNLQIGKGNWQEVENALQQAENASPAAADIPILRAEALVAQHQVDRAREVLIRARDRRPQQVELWTALASLADFSAKPEESARILREAEEKIGDRVELRLAWASRIIRSQGSGARSLAHSLSKLADNLEKFKSEDQARLLRELASAHYRLGNKEEARKLWTRLAELPESAQDLQLRLVLFQVALEEKDTAAMDQILSEIYRIEGKTGPFGRLCGATRLIQEAKEREARPTGEGRELPQLTKAQTLLDLAATQRPTWPSLLLAKADIEDFRGNVDKAIFNYRRAVELGEWNPRVLHRLVGLLCQQQRYQEADQEIRNFQKQGGLDMSLQRMAVAVSLQGRDSGRAVDLALQAVREDTKDYRDYLWLGQVLAAATHTPQAVDPRSSIRDPRSSTADQAERQFRRAVELAPQIPDTWLALVKHLAAMQRLSDAEKVIGQARDHLPKDSRELTLAACFESIERFDQARDECRRALENQPGNPAVMRTVASFYLRTGQADEAEPILKQLRQAGSGVNNSNANWARRQLALIFLGRGEFRQALALVGLGFDKTGSLVEVNPLARDEADEELRARARVLAAIHSRLARERAVAYLEDLSKRQVATSDDRLLLARLYEMNGSWEKVRTTIRALTTSFNQHPSYIAYYVHCLLHDHELADAERFIDQLEHQEQAQRRAGSRQRPESEVSSSVELRAQLLEARGENQKALALLESQARATNASPEAMIMLTSALARQKRWGDALELADRAWDQLPAETIGGISVALLRSCPASGEPGRVSARSRIERRLRAAVQVNPKSVNVVLQLADLLEIANRFQEAEALYRQILSEHGHNVIALNNLAWILAMTPAMPAEPGEKRSAEEALSLIHRAIEVAGPLPHLLDTRAVVYLSLGQSEPAIADLEQSLADSPSPFRYFHLARAQRQAHRPEAAAQAFRKAAEAGLEIEQLHPAERLAFREMSREYEIK